MNGCMEFTEYVYGTRLCVCGNPTGSNKKCNRCLAMERAHEVVRHCPLCRSVLTGSQSFCGGHRPAYSGKRDKSYAGRTYYEHMARRRQIQADKWS